MFPCLCPAPQICNPYYCLIHPQVKEMLDQAFFDQKKYAQGGWVTGLKYEDEILDLLRVRILCVGCASFRKAGIVKRGCCRSLGSWGDYACSHMRV